MAVFTKNSGLGGDGMLPHRLPFRYRLRKQDSTRRKPAAMIFSG
jgi:hypothetical protein